MTQDSQVQTNLRRILLLIASLGLGAVGLLLLGEPEPGMAEQMEESKPLAKVNGVEISESEVMDAAAGQLLQLERQRHQLLTNTITEKVRQRLVEDAAKAASLTTDEYLNREVVQKSVNISAEDAEAFYAARRNVIRQPFDAVEQQVREFLAMEQLINRLEDESEVEVLLEPFRVNVAAIGPAKGPADAPVTIVEFSDFQCPFCSRVNPTLQGVREKYGDKVRIVFRQFPLDQIHKEARKAGEASLCAAEQDKDLFWKLHDSMFADQGKLSVAALKAKAEALEGLDASSFNECLDSGRYAERVQEDVEAGARAGVTGTPSFFVNGRFLSGNVTAEGFADVIDDELRRLGKS